MHEILKIKATKAYFPVVLFQTIESVHEILKMKDTRAYFPVVVFQTIESVHEILIKATKAYFPVVVFQTFELVHKILKLKAKGYRMRASTVFILASTSSHQFSLAISEHFRRYNRRALCKFAILY